MNAGGYGNLLMNSEQPQGEYAVTIAFLRLITTLVKVRARQLESSESLSCCGPQVFRPISCPEVTALTVSMY